MKPLNIYNALQGGKCTIGVYKQLFDGGIVNINYSAGIINKNTVAVYSCAIADSTTVKRCSCIITNIHHIAAASCGATSNRTTLNNKGSSAVICINRTSVCDGRTTNYLTVFQSNAAGRIDSTTTVSIGTSDLAVLCIQRTAFNIDCAAITSSISYNTFLNITAGNGTVFQSHSCIISINRCTLCECTAFRNANVTVFQINVNISSVITNRNYTMVQCCCSCGLFCSNLNVVCLQSGVCLLQKHSVSTASDLRTINTAENSQALIHIHGS